ncbi:MAG: HAD family hydrolase [Candidatus Mcinerneyibacterium aminivorans]|jgi:putative hydrolase of the HAD superfamily|uniref:HAD family hydrolase n=1 Tax=Candidatus Mcinerneyibacterium aminivorans TaxID=2703815 RepID=A0A5D0MKA8_9BACT|nr:MAG: HAD family hydrolase [Candidatus Mcinerneyibacterium aminivorans]
MLESIIFDIDDTLMNHSGAVRKAIDRFYDKYIKGSNIEKKEFRNIWNEEQTKYMDDYLNNAVTFEEQRYLRIQSVFKKIGVYIDVDTAYEYFLTYLQLYEDNWSLYDDVKVTLEKLGDYKLGIISDGDSHQQRDKLKEFRIERYFNSIVVSGDINAVKPDKRIFKECLNRLETSSQKSLYIGDDYKRDFKGAIKNGLKACLIDRNSDIKIEKIDNNYKINSLLLLNKVLKKFR